MMRIAPDSTDVSVEIHLSDEGGLDKTDALAADLTCQYRRDNGELVDIELSDLDEINADHADGGIIYVAGGNYRLDLPDAAAAKDADYARVYLSGDGIIQTAGECLIAIDATIASRASATDQATLLARTAAKVEFNGPLNAAGTIIETIKGDDYTVDSPAGALSWSAPASDYGDLSNATFAFTSRRAVDGVAEIDGYADGFTVLDANTADQTVQLELPASQTKLLTPGVRGAKLTNEWQIKVTLDDAAETTFTLAHGENPLSGHTVLPEQV